MKKLDWEAQIEAHTTNSYFLALMTILAIFCLVVKLVLISMSWGAAWWMQIRKWSRKNNPFCNTVQSLHTQMCPHAGTHAPLRGNIRTTCARTHAHSPAHPYTHNSHTYTCTPLQQYTHHLCTPLHLLTNIYKYQAYNCQNAYLRISTNIHPCIPLQNIYKYPHYHTTVPII